MTGKDCDEKEWMDNYVRFISNGHMLYGMFVGW